MIKRLLFLSIMLFIGIASLLAQEFIFSPWGGGDSKCWIVNKNQTGFELDANYKSVNFEQGYAFQSLAVIDNFYYVFEHEGKYYGAKQSDLRFSSNNPKGMENPLPLKVQKHDTMAGHFYGSTAALWVMILAMAVAAIIAVSYIKLKILALRYIFLITVPAAILIFSIIEIYGFIEFGTDIFWWCEYDRYGFFGSLLRVIPFAALVAAQVFSIKVYEFALFNMDDTADNDSPKKISLKPAVISLIIFIPVTLATAISLALLGYNNSPLLDIVTLIVLFGSLGTGLYITFMRNVKTFGRMIGMWVTIFSIIYIIGCIISAIALIILIIRIIIQILIVVGTIFILMMAGSRRRVYRNGRVYEEIS